MIWPAVWGSLLFATHVFLVAGVIPIVLLRRKDPTATLAWMFAIMLMPLAGAIAFLAFGSDRFARKTRLRRVKTRKSRRPTAEILGDLISPIDVKGQLQLYKLLDRINPVPPLEGNAIELITDMERNYELQLAAINSAERHIHVEYYIVQPDESGFRFQSALIEAAKRGVKVRFLYDAVGSIGLKSSYLGEMRSAGIENSVFIPLHLLRRRWIFNFRNHRKILIVDGRVAFVGGANIGNEYLGKSPVGKWCDLQVKIEGPAVLPLQDIFLEDWEFASEARVQDDDLFPKTTKMGDVVAQVAPGGPDTEVQVYHELYFSAIANAVERLRITTPYFVPTAALLVALQTAARRGVDIEIIVPGKSTHTFVHWAGQSYYEELIEAGVKIYEFPSGFMHAKMLTVDNRWSIVGTANFDSRSLRLNFEVGVVFYDVETTLALDSIFEDWAKRSRRIDLQVWKQRGLTARVLENSARLFSAVL